jgi:nitrile hydratase subunit beta
MNGIHDLGGMHGFGAIGCEEDEPVFHEAWEGRVFGMSLVAPPEIAPIAGFRHTIERMDPVHYLTSSYYEHWLVVLETGVVEAGIVTREELAARAAFFRDHAAAAVPRREDPEQIDGVLARMHEPQPLHRPSGMAPRFNKGDPVRARNVHPTGHTRLPRYVRGRRGIIARLRSIHDFPDTPADGIRTPPQAVYSVRFAARELWGESGEERSDVYLDLWDSYLEPDHNQE